MKGGRWYFIFVFGKFRRRLWLVGDRGGFGFVFFFFEWFEDSEGRG